MIFANWTRVSIQKCLYWLNTAVLLFLTYRLVQKVSGYQDAETLIKASNSLSQQLNPYDNEFFLNGYSLSIPARIYSTLFPVEIGARLYVLINIAFIGFVIWHIFNKQALHKIILVLLIVLASSPSRAMIASVQHTGVILGCSYFALILARSQVPHTKILTYTKTLVIALLLLTPIEMKPQLMLPLIGVLFFHKKFRKYVILTFVIALSSHLLLSLYYRMPLDKYWVERLLSRSSETTRFDTRENSPWALATNLTAHSHLWLKISLALFMLMIIWLILYSKKQFVQEKIFFLALSVPLILTYIHPYDLILPVIVFAQRFVVEPFSRGSVFMVSFFLFPTLYFNWSSFLFSICLILYLWLNSRFKFSQWVADISEIVGALVCYSLLDYLVSDLWLKINIHFSILIIGSLFFVFKWQLKPTLDDSYTQVDGKNDKP